MDTIDDCKRLVGIQANEYLEKKREENGRNGRTRIYICVANREAAPWRGAQAAEGIVCH